MPNDVRLTSIKIPFFNFINFGAINYLILSGILESFAIVILLLSLIMNFKAVTNDFIDNIYDRKNSGRRNIIIIFSITFLVTSFYSFLNIEYYHDGVSFNPVMDVLNGKLLFKETCGNKYGVLTVYLQSFAMLIFGKYLIVTRLLTTFTYGLIGVSLYLIWSRIINSSIAFLGCIISLLMLPYYYISNWPFLAWASIYGLFFQLLSLLYLIKYFESYYNKETNKTSTIKRSGILQFKENHYLFYSGMTASLCYWCKENVGMYHMFGCILILVIQVIINIRNHKNEIISNSNTKSKLSDIKSQFIYLFAGFIICSSIFIAYFIITDSFNDWYIQTIKYGRMWIGNYGDQAKWHPQTGSVLPIIILKIQEYLNLHFGGTFNLPIYVIRNLFLVYYTDSSLIWRLIPIINIIVLINVIVNIFIKNQITVRNKIILIIILSVLPSWLQYFPALDIHHTWWGVVLMIGVVIYFLKNITEMFKFRSKMAGNILFVVLLMMVFSYDISSRIITGTKNLLTTMRDGRMIKSPKEFKYIIVNRKEAQFLEEFEKDLNYYMSRQKNHAFCEYVVLYYIFNFSKSPT